ncbi:MAG: IS3 family transposase [Sarcina sp.]
MFSAIDDYIYLYNHSRYQIKNRTPVELRCTA